MQMFEVAFSRRMCCSRVCNARRNAGRPSVSALTPTIRPGMERARSSVTAMKAGATELLTIPFRAQALLDAIQRGLAADRERRAELALMAGLQDRFDSLSPREREVMALVTAGLLNKQIAAELEVSEVTVKVHRGHVMRKMQARSLPELVRYADRLAAASRKA